MSKNLNRGKKEKDVYFDLEEIKDKILLPKISKILCDMGYDLVNLEIKKGRTINLEIEIYSKNRSISLKDCEKVSNVISRILDIEDPIPLSYNLVVSSPGVNRKLKSLREYEIFSGCEVEVKINNFESYNLKKDLNIGVLVGVDGDIIKFNIDDREVWVDVSDIAYTKLYFDVSRYFGGM
ncbi:MAG: ribosome maturation factor RimP [Brevinematia bacterium]